MHKKHSGPTQQFFTTPNLNGRKLYRCFESLQHSTLNNYDNMLHLRSHSSSTFSKRTHTHTLLANFACITLYFCRMLTFVCDISFYTVIISSHPHPNHYHVVPIATALLHLQLPQVLSATDHMRGQREIKSRIAVLANPKARRQEPQ